MKRREEHDGSMATAFQPIYDLATGHVAGAEALTRFEGGHGPDVWFAQAATAGLAVEVELSAVEAALSAAVQLPELLYVSVNASPATCLSPNTVYLGWFGYSFELPAGHLAFDDAGVGSLSAWWQEVVEYFAAEAGEGLPEFFRGKKPGGRRGFAGLPGGCG